MRILFLVFVFASFSFSQRPAWLGGASSSSAVSSSSARVAKASPKPSAVSVPVPDPRVDSLSRGVDSLFNAVKFLSGRLVSLDSVVNSPPPVVVPDTVQRRWHVVWTVANADTMRSFGVSDIFNYPRSYKDLLGILNDTKKAGHSVYEFDVSLSNYDTLRYVMGGTSSRSTGNVISQGGNYEGKIEYYNTGLTMLIYPSGKASIEYISTDMVQTTLRLSARQEGNCISASTQFLTRETTRVLWILWSVHSQQVKHLWLSACYEDA